jgi:hypothetical protein
MERRTNRTFEEGARVRVKRENYLSPLIRGKKGTIMNFFLQTGVYKVKIDNNPNPVTLKATELELID